MSRSKRRLDSSSIEVSATKLSCKRLPALAAPEDDDIVGLGTVHEGFPWRAERIDSGASCIKHQIAHSRLRHTTAFRANTPSAKRRPRKQTRLCRKGVRAPEPVAQRVTSRGTRGRGILLFRVFLRVPWAKIRFPAQTPSSSVSNPSISHS